MGISEKDKKALISSKKYTANKIMNIITQIIDKYYGDLFFDSDIEMLTNGAECKKMFNLTTSNGVQLAVYIEKDPTLEFKEQLSEMGVKDNVYNKSNPKIINGRTYYSTSQLYEDGNSKQKIWEWVCKKVGISINDFTYEIIEDYFYSDFSRRFITSLIAKPFVILTGNSGTGKTRIAKQFSKFMEIEEKEKVENKKGIEKENNNNWLPVPVGADWTDNTQIIGFYNPLAEGGGKYEKTEILKLIERANKNKDIPYFLILDEMNLSHVERYFSDFLSHMEIPDEPFYIDGYGKIEYPENLFVIGTVNIDETTYMFSPKVLDRANVIEFKPEKSKVIELFDGEKEKVDIKPAGKDMATAFLQLAKSVRNDEIIIDKNDKNLIITIFGAVYDILEKGGFEFAFRTVKEIRHYICASKEFLKGSGKYDIKEVIDEQLLQKILPKIHGNKKEIGEMLKELKNICEKYNFTKSKEKIEKMERKLADTQYASFI